MVSGAKTEITIGRQFKQDRIDIQRLKGRLRQQRSPGARIPPRFGTGPSGARLDPIQRLATQGDSMIGPIAFFPQAVTVAAGVIDIGITTSDYSTRIIVLGQGAAADNLDTILNARFAGQFLVLQAVATTPITLKHLTGNIRIPSGNDYIIKGLESVILFFDSTTNEWVLVAGDSGLTNPMTEDFDMAGFNILNLDIINWEDGDVEESVAVGIKWTMALNHSIEIQNSSLVRQVFIDTQAPSFDLSVLLRMVGSVEQTTITQLDGVDAAFQIETSGPQWLFKIDGTNVFQVVEEVATTEYAFNPLVVGDGGFKYFFESGTYFTGSATSGRINVYNDAVNRYAFTNDEFVILNSENLLLTGTTFGGYFQVRERAADPGGLANNFRLYGKDVGGVTKGFIQFSDATVIEIGAGGGANVNLSNLVAPTAINAELILNNGINIKPVFDLGSDLGTNILAFSSVYFRNLFLDDPLIHIKFTGGNMQLTTSPGNDIILKEGATTFVSFDGGLNRIIFGSTYEVEFNNDVRMDGGNVFKSFDSQEIGFLVTDSSTAIGAQGTIQIPTKVATPSSAAQADTDFGAIIGAIGMYQPASGNPTMVVRDTDGTWSTEPFTNSGLT